MRVHGLLLLDKPLGLTSNAALQRARRLLDADKAGHGGTLDPLATGLLPLMFGEACKLAEGALDGDKAYRAVVRFGERTATDDAEGDVIARSPVDFDVAALEAALAGFRGSVVQVPPVFSALKVGGQPLYKLARRGEAPEPAPRTVMIHELVLEDWAPPDATLRIACSKGTYVRAIARDLGLRLGCGAHLAGLRRLVVGAFDVAAAVTLDGLAAEPAPSRPGLLIGLERLVAGWPSVQLGPAECARFRNGQAVPFAASDGLPPSGAAPAAGSERGAQRIAVFSDGRLIGLATQSSADPAQPTGLVAPSRIIVS